MVSDDDGMARLQKLDAPLALSSNNASEKSCTV